MESSSDDASSVSSSSIVSGDGSSITTTANDAGSHGGEDMRSSQLIVDATVDDSRRVTRGQQRKKRDCEDSGDKSAQSQAKKARRDESSSSSSSCSSEETTPNAAIRKRNSRNGPRRNGNAKASVRKQKKPRCSKCLQLNHHLISFSGDPEGAINELRLFDRDDLLLEDGSQNEHKSFVKITMFTVYDENGHLCQFDSGLLERNSRLYMSGFVKTVIEDDPTPTGGIATKRIGPIDSWWFSGFDGGNLLLGLSTKLLNYYVMSPAPEYEPFMKCMDKIMLSKYIMEYLEDNPSDTFEEMCDHVKTIDAKLNDETVLLYSEFIVAQLASYDSEADCDELALLSTRAARRLQELAGARQQNTPSKISSVVVPRKKAPDTLATTTPLVFSLLSGFFGDQMDASNSVGKNCGNCDRCRREPCMMCSGCKNKLKRCKHKRCENKGSKAIVIDEVSDEEDVEDEMDRKVRSTEENTKRKIAITDNIASKVTWNKSPVLVHKRTKYYSSVTVGVDDIVVGDCLMFEPEVGNEPYLGKVEYMYEVDGEKMLHVSWFWRGTDTVLGQSTDASQVFVTNACDSVPAGSVLAKCSVEHLKSDKNFRSGSNRQSRERLDLFQANRKKNAFYYTMCYDHVTARFEDPPDDIICEDEELMFRFCTSCYRTKALAQFKEAVLGKRVVNSKVREYSSFYFRDETFTVGECVFLDPKACTTLPSREFLYAKARLLPTTDSETYPERYRKTNDVVCGGNVNVPDPFVIGRILSITGPLSNVTCKGALRLAIFYRPENTCLGTEACYNTDYNVLYWTKCEISVPLSLVRGKCVVAYAGNIKDLESFRTQGPYRFYFEQAYDVKSKEFEKVPSEAISYSGKGVGTTYEDYPSVTRKLKSLDVFSGCGGLSDGFHRAELAKTCWAIENCSAAAKAFKLNNPECTVFEDDCNQLLKKVLEGETCDKNGQQLPRRGEVDIIMGGPPCQGFSGMNRFNTREYSLFKNSLVATYLSYCEYYRPRFFLLENVRNFVSYKRNMVLKQVLNCLVQIGYQCGFAILQAGHYGIPQTRRRLIIWAAAPGEKLPKFPEPQHVFNGNGGQLSVCVDEAKIISNISWTNSAPYRCVTVHDALGDLPAIKCGASALSIPYGGSAVSHFQKIVRDNGNVLKDHVTKPMNDLTMERFAYIPLAAGADWRDLPNIEIIRNGQSIAGKLIYTHKDKDGALRGVCCCANGKNRCDPVDRQSYTLIPWCLPHTGNRHAHWMGLFGRLSLDGYFCTTITNPEPMGKQGCVIHPTQHRVVSVRECARSQGFSDSYIFYGRVLDCYRQIGNAVPPPLAYALAMELRRCLLNSLS